MREHQAAARFGARRSRASLHADEPKRTRTSLASVSLPFDDHGAHRGRAALRDDLGRAGARAHRWRGLRERARRRPRPVRVPGPARPPRRAGAAARATPRRTGSGSGPARSRAAATPAPSRDRVARAVYAAHAGRPAVGGVARRPRVRRACGSSSRLAVPRVADPDARACRGEVGAVGARGRVDRRPVPAAGPRRRAPPAQRARELDRARLRARRARGRGRRATTHASASGVEPPPAGRLPARAPGLLLRRPRRRGCARPPSAIPSGRR